MTFCVVRIDPDGVAESLESLLISPGHLEGVAEISETLHPFRIQLHRHLEVLYRFIISVVLGKQNADVVVCHPVSLDRRQSMAVQIVTVIPVADLSDSQQRKNQTDTG